MLILFLRSFFIKGFLKKELNIFRKTVYVRKIQNNCTKNFLKLSQTMHRWWSILSIIFHPYNLKTLLKKVSTRLCCFNLLEFAQNLSTCCSLNHLCWLLFQYDFTLALLHFDVIIMNIYWKTVTVMFVLKSVFIKADHGCFKETCNSETL